MDALERIFGTTKPVVAMLHFPGLPGRPRHDVAAGPGHLVDVVGRDLAVLQEAGVDGVMFCNEADYPYQLRVGPEIPAAMAAAIGALRSEIRVPYGVNILWDAVASLALARATGARFIREVLTGVYESDLGMIAPAIGDISGYRTIIAAEYPMPRFGHGLQRLGLRRRGGRGLAHASYHGTSCREVGQIARGRREVVVSVVFDA